jgi:hypothetical protein
MASLDARMGKAPATGPSKVGGRLDARAALAALALGGILAGCEDDRPTTPVQTDSPAADAQPPAVLTPMTQAAVTDMSDNEIRTRFIAEERNPILRERNNLERDIEQYNRSLGDIGAVLHQFDSYFTSAAHTRVLAEYGNRPKVPGDQHPRVDHNAAKRPNLYSDIVGGSSIHSFMGAQGNVYPLDDRRFRENVDAFFATEPSISTDQARWREYNDQRFNLSFALTRANTALTQIKEHVQAFQALLSQGDAGVGARDRDYYAERILFLTKVVHDYAPVLEAWKQMVDNHRPAYLR